ncbi:MAG: primosomal protein N' [Streptosporangiaceae bacterium]|nr:primosomal protein N' [Streptosporangiaceae bacterium]MBV9855163.1 primosomal protein N' [Streptosporangiaceae bacterium]
MADSDTQDTGSASAGAGAGSRPRRTARSGAGARKGAGARTTGRPAKTLVPAAHDPIARVAVDIPLAHLDRPFDYLVPERLGKDAKPGVRVRVRFAGQLVDGYVLERAVASEHRGRLAYLDRVVSPEPVLTKEIAGLARAVADRYAGTLADVLRLAIPPRHAATEAGHPGPKPAAPRRPAPGSWALYPAGEAFLAGLAAGRDVRAAWSALPGPGWPEEIARAAGTTAAAGRGAVIVVPDARDLARVDQALTRVLGGAEHHVTLAADLGPAERYRRWLAVRRGTVAVAAGTRAAMFAPVRDLGLVVLWDDGDDLHAEPRAPYPNAREVLALRAHRRGAAALIGGFARTTELTQLVAAGWARPLTPADPRAAAPRIRAAADDAELARDAAAVTARLPSLALRTARAALGQGPVLVQVPRRGYLAAIACGRCRARARCNRCGGPLEIGGVNEVPRCRWCGALAASWSCQRCGNDQIRAVVTGAARTAEELGRAFPGVKVRTSGGRSVIGAVPDEPALVIATPGAEPLGRYAAALLLDGWALLSLPGLRAAEEALRRWLGAAALVRPAAGGGTVLVHADASLPAVQALIRWDPVNFTERELAERAELRFPPAVRMAAVTGAASAVGDFLEAELPASAEVLGPVPAEDGPPGNTAGAGGVADDEEQVRALIRVPRAAGLALARSLHAAQAARSARKEPGVIRVQLDPAI